jgi:hypothetical protein
MFRLGMGFPNINNSNNCITSISFYIKINSTLKVHAFNQIYKIELRKRQKFNFKMH